MSITNCIREYSNDAKRKSSGIKNRNQKFIETYLKLEIPNFIYYAHLRQKKTKEQDL